MNIKNKYGEKAEIIEEKQIGKTKRTIIFTEKNEFLEVTKIAITKGTWESKASKKERLAKERKKAKKEKTKDINVKINEDLFPFIKLIGIDQSTTGSGYTIAKLTGEIVEINEINSEEEDFIRRTMETVKILKQKVIENNIKIIALENIYLEVPRFRSAILAKVKSYEQLSYLKNRIIEMAYEMKLDIIVVYAASWKAHYKINSKGKTREDQKKEAIRIVEKLLGEKVSDNKAEGILIAKYIIEKRIEKTKGSV